MAKQFLGFTPEQVGRLIPELKDMQGDEQRKIIAANPAYSQRMGYATQRAMNMINPEPTGFNEGGDVQAKLDQAKQRVSDATIKLQSARDAQSADPSNESLVQAVQRAEVDLNKANEAFNTANAAFKTSALDTGAEMTASMQSGDAAKKSEVATIDPNAEGTTIAEGTGQVSETAPTATTTTAETAAPATAPVKTEAPEVEAKTVTDEVQSTLDKLSAATGKPSDEALAEAATMSPDQLAQLGLSAAQIDEAQKVKAPDARKVEAGELIEGSTVDMARVRKETNFEAATGQPSSNATVQGQLTGLMEDFETGKPPAWAAGAMRAAAAQMAARGLSASSMAGQAIVQAAMESALPIAVRDSQTSAQFEMQNLSNRQQAAMFAAEKRAEFLGLEFNQEFQARVANAAKISDIANMNFTAEQTIALENARLAQSVDIANLNSANAKVLADAAAMTAIDTANLNNRQQAQVQQANAFLQIDMKNLDNEQQTSIFKTQQITNAMLSDQAAQNAAQQFNATNDIQVQQFYDNLTATVQLQNNEQINAQNRFNAGEANAVALHNSAMRDAREQFNAQNSLIIEQANTKWFRDVATTNTAATNQANRDFAMAQNEMSVLAYNAMMQETRDLMSYAWQTANNDAERATQLAIARIQSDDARASAKASRTNSMWGALGSVAAAIAVG